MRLTSCALALFLLAVTSAIAQKQTTEHQIDVPRVTDMGVDLPHSTGAWTLGGSSRYKVYALGSASPAWLQQRSDDLLDLLGCYLDKDSVANEVAAETKNGDDLMNAIETRIKLLKTLAQKKVASHCK
jgi:hypothetical protein